MRGVDGMYDNIQEDIINDRNIAVTIFNDKGSLPCMMGFLDDLLGQM